MGLRPSIVTGMGRTLIVQAAFFASPISYQADQLPGGLRWLNTVNPISVDLAALRNVALQGMWPDWPLFGLHLLIAVALLVASIAHLRAVEHRIVDLA
jgi:ABC-type polysaccharide/polyol phosphate export permease